MGIKIINEKRSTDYTFIDDNMTLGPNKEGKKANTKRDKIEPEFRLRSDSAKSSSKLKHKSKLSGGHNMQGHSSVYE